MSSRALLGGAAILAVAATVFWYVAVAPSRGSAVEPDQSVRVAASATAAGDGSWVRYLITIKNLADGDFAGDVLLVDQDQDAEAGVTPSITSLTRNPQLTTVPAVAGQSAYRVHLSVPSRKSRTVAVLAPDFFDVVQALMGGRLLDAEAVDRAAVIPVAVLSDIERPAEAILGLRYDRFNLRVASFNAARDFPATPLQLAGYTTVVIDQFDSAALSAAQVRALRDFVGFGGTLVLAGGSSWRRTLAPLPADLLPVRPTTTETVSLAPVAALAGAGADDRAAPAAVGSLAAGARRVLEDAAGVPLVAELDYGAGKVVELAFDPSGQEVADSPYSALAWSQALARTIDQPPGSGPMATTLLGPDATLTALLPAAEDAPLPPLWLMATMLVFYVLLAGPIGYLVVRRRWRQPALYWAVVPLVAVVFTSVFYGAGSSLQGGLQDHEIQVIRVGPAQAVNVLEYHRVLFLRRGNHVIEPPADTLAAPLTLETFRTTGSTCERCTSQLGGLPSGSEHALPGPQPMIEESGVVYGSVRVVAASGVGHGPLGLQARLAIRNGRVQGTLANPNNLPIWQVAAFTSDGQVLHRADLAPAMPAGAQAAVDGQLVTADNASAGSAADAVLLRAVAAAALTARGQVVLVGLAPPLPSNLTVDGKQPPQAGLAVLVQTVPVAGADSSLRDVQRKWLTATSGDQRSGFADVYDLQVPAPSGPLRLTYNSQWSPSVDVYDWSRGGFVPVAGGRTTDPTQNDVSLSGDQIRDGVVRVRLHEPRLSWATTVWLDVPGP